MAFKVLVSRLWLDYNGFERLGVNKDMAWQEGAAKAFQS
jgi:hypothetical protein